MNIFPTATIRIKLALVFAGALVFVVAAGLLGLVQLHSVNAVTREMREVWLPRIESLSGMQGKVTEHRLLALRRLGTADNAARDGIARGMDAALTALRERRKAYLATGVSGGERALFEEFQRLWDGYEWSLGWSQEHPDVLDQGGTQAGFGSVVPIFDRAAETLGQLLAITKEHSRQAAARAETTSGSALELTLVVILLAIAGALGAMTWSTRNVSLPILRIAEAMRRLAAGDISAAAIQDTGRHDEIGVLAGAVDGYRDSLERSRRLAKQADRERERLHTAVNNMPIGLVMFDASKRLIVGNERYRELYDLPHGVTRPGAHLREMLECRLDQGNFEGSREAYIERILELVEQKETTTRVTQLGNGRTVSIIHHPVEGGGWIGTHEDVTERVRAEARIHHMARHDALTDLPNRTLFAERIEAALEQAQAGESVAVLCLDLDRFKQVNDTLGHPIGDALLKCVAERLRHAVRKDDTIARFGGDEFAVVQTAVGQPDAARHLAERIIESLSAAYDIEDHRVVIGASIGVAIAPLDGKAAEVLLKNADIALYRAKSDGRGLVRFFEPAMDAAVQARRLLELDLRAAIKDGQFEVHYQPILDVTTKSVTCFEALLRWRHPERGLLLPAEFIPLAEETGLIVPLGAWVLHTACRDAAAWAGGIRVAVNISPVQFRNNGLAETVLQALAASGLAPKRLELEITEGVLLIEHDTTLPVLHRLRGLGVRIVMDDFGTGYSSVGYLRTFPFDKIKIDRSFINNMARDDSALAIIRAVTGLSSSLRIATTAEGVETSEEFDGVCAEGCTEVQGFLIGRAVAATEVGRFLDGDTMRAIAAA